MYFSGPSQNLLGAKKTIRILSGPTLRTPPPPYRAIGYSYTYRIYLLQCVAGYRAIPPLLGVSQNYVERRGGVRGGSGGGGVSQLKPALCAIGRYRGVSQLYCRKSRLDGLLSESHSSQLRSNSTLELLKRRCPTESLRIFMFVGFFFSSHSTGTEKATPNKVPYKSLSSALGLKFENPRPSYREEKPQTPTLLLCVCVSLSLSLYIPLSLYLSISLSLYLSLSLSLSLSFPFFFFSLSLSISLYLSVSLSLSLSPALSPSLFASSSVAPPVSVSLTSEFPLRKNTPKISKNTPKIRFSCFLGIPGGYLKGYSRSLRNYNKISRQ